MVSFSAVAIRDMNSKDRDMIKMYNLACDHELTPHDEVCEYLMKLGFGETIDYLIPIDVTSDSMEISMEIPIEMNGDLNGRGVTIDIDDLPEGTKTIAIRASV